MAIQNDRGEGGASAAAQDRIFNIPSSEPFLFALARAILKGDGSSSAFGGFRPEALTDITILLPTRRAVRSLQEQFLALSSGRALLLPRIRAISETNEDASLIASLSPSIGQIDVLDIPPAAGELERHVVLTSLVMRWSEAMRQTAKAAEHDGSDQILTAAGIQTAAQASNLARELAGLMDMIETESVTISRLESIVPEMFSEHWQETLKFLQIVLVMWPNYLEERNRLSPVARRNAVILSEASRLARLKPTAPFIVAGVTGSIPATTELMRVVIGLEKGAVVLPGLDQTLDTSSWDTIDKGSTSAAGIGAHESGHPEHPQFGLKKLIDALGVGRLDIKPLPGCQIEGPRATRLAFTSEVMRPSTTTEKWHGFVRNSDKVSVAEALADIHLVEAATSGEEAEVVSLILRGVADITGRTAALVTRDRLLARRVAVRLESWGIRVDDSAGRPLAKTLPGTFLDLIVEVASQHFSPVSVMALLKHPLARFGKAAGMARRSARALELLAFRTIYLGRGLQGLRNALIAAQDSTSPHQSMRRVRPDDMAGAFDLVDHIERCFAGLSDLSVSGKCGLKALVESHVRTAELIAEFPNSDEVPGQVAGSSSALWNAEAGEAARLIFAGLLENEIPDLAIGLEDYPDFYRSLVSGEVVRSRVPVHPRISIWGPFEARLQQPDVVILGGLNEGSWPEAAEPGPWLNRPMRQTLGLPQPEERIGYSCHDFSSLLGANEVYLTRALKVDGAPTVPSRWLMRIKALVQGMGLSGVLDAPLPWLGWSAHRLDSGARQSAKRPRPRPPIELRPRKLSVSDVERWVQNPYSIFASRILNLEPLMRLGEPPNAALRGSLVHSVLSEFVKRFGSELPDNPESELLSIAREVLGAWTHDDRIAAFWVPRFERFAKWFADTEPARRANSDALVSEVDGKLELGGPYGAFTLNARADRIDITSSGLRITDYKTMAEQALKTLMRRVAAGGAPQLPLEGVIASSGGFTGLPINTVDSISFISASGSEPPGAETRLDGEQLKSVIETSHRGLLDLIARFDDETTPYAALRRPGFAYDYDDYYELARVGEWSLAGSEEGD